MKKTILIFLAILVVSLSNFGNSQCQYSFSSLDQTISINGDPAAASVNTLSTCVEYVFDYSVSLSSTSVSSLTDDITLELPYDIQFLSLVPSSSVTVNSSSGNTVSLHLSGWNISNTLQFQVIGIPSSCESTSLPGNSWATLDGALACSPVNSPNSITIVSPQLYVQNVSLYTSKTIGDVDEIVLKIFNAGGNGTVIQNILMDYTLNANIESFNNTYYFSASAAQGTGTNSYTYTLPGSIFTATLPAGTLSINQSDFQNVLGHGYLANNEVIYLHIPYFVNACGETDGSFDLKKDCGNSVTCNTKNVLHHVSVISGAPTIGAGNIITLHDENATFCAAAGGQDMDLGWRMFGSTADPTGGPSSYARVTDLQLLLLVDNSFGAADPSSFTISHGSSSINVSSVIELVNPSFPLLGGATTGTLYKVHLEQLAVTGGNWQPLGANSLSDLDGDGFLDDLIENGSIDIHVDYTYHTTCPLYSDHGAYYTIAILEWHYGNECYAPAPNSAVDGNFTWYQDASSYGYTATGAGGELTLPPDVIAGDPFEAELCFAPYHESFTLDPLGFNCPDGFHRVIFNIPNGYHLDFTGLSASSSHPGWHELPDMTVTSVAGGTNPTQQVSPIVQEYCNPGGTGRIIEVRFGKIPYDLAYFARPYTMLLPCLNLPMLLDCGTSDPNCPGLPNNFGFDNMDFKLEFVCDEACNTCTSYIVGGHASTFHHCPGECESYFGTDPYPEFKRSTLGFANTTSGYLMGSDLTQPSDLTTATEPVIDLSTAYPGDQIALGVNGSFHGTPGVSYTPSTGASYSEMMLQVRYNDLLPGERKEARIFDLEQLGGDGILITENSPVNGTSSYLVPVSDIVMTDYVSAGVVYLNLNFLSTGAAAFIDESNANYTFNSNLHLRVRSEPFSSTYQTFFSPGKHVLTSLRFEYKGIRSADASVNGSCDDYGANFRTLQARAFATDGVYIGEPTYCGYNQIYFRFYNDAALYDIADDFPNEFRAYGQLNSELDATIPAGYTFIEAKLVQDGKEFDASLPNNFDTDYYPSHISLPITPASVSTDAFGNTIVHFNGLNGLDPTDHSWPSLDLDKAVGSQYIYLKLLPSCDVPLSSTVYFSGDYTLGVNQDLPFYQHSFPFTTLVPLGHYNPNINIVNPVATVNAYDGLAEFSFSVCNENLLMTGDANSAWIAFENSSIDGLDLTNAVLTNTQTNSPVSFTTYVDAAGHQAIIANIGSIAKQACMTFTLSVHVSANGCVTGNEQVSDFLTVYGGNSCDGTIATQPVEACTKEITQFSFNRYPSDLELILPSDAYPAAPVEMCSGILEYNFILNSYQVGAVSDIDFWTDLPNGLSLHNITFTTLGSTPSVYSASTYDASTFGPGGNLPGWNVLDDLGLPYLPGSVNNTAGNNQILVHLTVQSSCDYDLSSPVLCYANSINSCGQETGLLEMSSVPEISNTTLVNDLVVTPSITFSGGEDTLGCNNVAMVTLTITNNSDVSNLSEMNVVAQVPSSPLLVNPGTGTLTGNEVTWNIPANTIPANATISVSYTITNPGVICQNDVPMSALINFSEDVNCTSTGGSCNVTLATEPVLFDIDVCCNCALSVAMSSEPIRCKASPGSATATVSGAVGNTTYVWSNGQTTATATGLDAGIYTVTVTDENGCTKTDSVAVGSAMSPVIITATADQDTICEGETVEITPGGGTDYVLTDGTSVEQSNGDPFVLTPPFTTTYTVTGYDEYGCAGDTIITIAVKPNVEPTFEIGTSYCAGTAVPALPGTSLNGITGTWSPSAISNTTSGTYIFTPAAGQCAGAYTLNVTINPTPVITVNSATICLGQSAVLTASGADSYTWTPSGTLSSGTGATVTATPSVTTTYTVYGTDEQDCSSSSTSTVTVNPVVTATFTITSPYCSGAAIPALPTTSDNGITGTWSPAINNLATTEYVFTPDSGQCAGTVGIVIEIIPMVKPTFKIPNKYCEGSTPDTLPATSLNGITGTWSPSSTINTASPGSYTYTFTPAAGQCASVVSVTINIVPLETPTFSAVGPYCSGAAIPALPTTSDNGISGTWSPAISNTTSGTYTFTPDPGFCATAATMNIDIKPNVETAFKKIVAYYCVGATPSVLPTTSFNGVTGTWSPSAINTSTAGVTTYTFTPTPGVCATTFTVTVTVSAMSTPTFTVATSYCSGASIPALPTVSDNGFYGSWSPAINNTATTTYTFTPDGGQCATAVTLTINITPNPVPVISWGDGGLSVCAGGSVWLYSSSSTGNTWSNGATTSMINATAGTYTVTVNNGGGCTATSAPVTVTTIPTPAAPSLSSNSGICSGATLNLMAGTISGATYTWTGPSGYTSTLQNPSRSPATAAMSGTYYCYVTVGGCPSATSSISVTVKPTPSAPTISSNSPVCAGSVLDLTALPISGASYTWSGPFGYASTLQNPSRSPATVAMSGTYSCFVTVGGCQSATSSTSVTVKALPTVSGTASTCVNGSPVTLTGSPTGGTWSSSATSIATINATTGVITPSATNSGPVTITYTQGGCQRTFAFTVNALPAAPTINGGATSMQICEGDYGVLGSSYTSGNTWVPSGATSQSISVPAPSGAAVSYGVYYTNPSTGCKSPTTYISVSKVNCPKPGHCILAANFNASVSGCNWTFTSTSTSGIGTIASPGSGYTFNWTISNASTGALVTTGTGFTFTYGGFPSTGSYIVCLTVLSNSNTNCFDQANKTISVNCSSGLVIASSSNHLVSRFEARTEHKDLLENLDYFWSFGDGTFSTEAKPEHTYAKPGTYEVCLKNGAESDELTCNMITVTDKAEAGPETGVIPVMSVNPNPTSGQTTVVLDGVESKTVEIKVFNSLGAEVTTLFAKTCCNDKIIRLVWNAKEVPAGVYFVKAEVDSKTMVEKIVVAH